MAALAGDLFQIAASADKTCFGSHPARLAWHFPELAAPVLEITAIRAGTAGKR